MKQRGKDILFILTLIALCAVAVMIYMVGQSRRSYRKSSEKSNHFQMLGSEVEWNGKTYTYNHNLKNILFIGIDKRDEPADISVPGEAGQADCIILLSVDEQAGTGRILQINRNTMVSLSLYDMSGSYLESVDGQIALQYAYDIGGESSCWATKKTVRQLLYDLRIDGYIAMDMDGISEINDLAGGVDVTLEDDYTYVDSSYMKGSTIHLEGDKAEQFVRYRNTDEFNSVEGRMNRQVEYLRAFAERIRSMDEQKVYEILSGQIGENILTDMDIDTLTAFAGTDMQWEETEYLPGTMKQGDIYEEYYVDDDALRELLIRMFYKEKN